MKTIIAGSRDCTDYESLIRALILLPWEISEVVSGTARGADQLGERWAIENEIPLYKYPAKWRFADGSFDKAAGFVRNSLMADNADALLALWDGKSNGTRHMIKTARNKGLMVYVYNYEKEAEYQD